MIVYNKLVRDKIPEIIKKDQKECVTKILDMESYITELKKKFVEEMEEYQTATTEKEALEELADILEILQSLAKIHGASFEKIEQIRKEKAIERGGFSERVFLVGVKK